jgi:hypothetical protein
VDTAPTYALFAGKNGGLIEIDDAPDQNTGTTSTVTVRLFDWPGAMPTPPSVTTTNGSSSFVAGDNQIASPIQIDSGLTVADSSKTTLASATVSITSNFHAGEDSLNFNNTSSTTFGNIAASYNSGTGVLTLTSAGASATLAQWQAALDAVTYGDSAVTPNNATRTISFVVNDGTMSSSAATKSVTVADTDQTPKLTTTSGHASFTKTDGQTASPITVDGGVSVSDLDNTTLASATVSITSGFHSGEDVLAFNNTSSTTYGNIAASYNGATGVLTLTSVGATATLAQWKAALDSVTYDDTASSPNTATRTINFVVNDGTKSSAGSTKLVDISVLAGPATHLSIAAPSNETAGTPETITVTALDASNNIATGYVGTVHFTSTDGMAGLPSDYTFVAGDNGVHTFSSGETLKTAGSQTVTATDTQNPSIAGTSNTDIVSPAAATHFVVTIPGSTTAGAAGSVTVEALDQFGNVATGYTGTVHFTSTDGLAVLPLDYTFLAGDNGVHTFTNGETLKTAGSQTLTATDTVTPSVTGTSSADIVSPAAATHFVVTAPASATAGTPGSVTVEALDQFGNVATGYTGTIHFTSTDGQAGLPTDYTFVAGDHGVHTFTNGETLNTAGSQTFTATDTHTSSITGTSSADIVAPAAATHFLVTGPASTAAGTPGSVTVEALDQFGNVATGYTGTVHFTSTDGQAVLPSDYTFVAGDNGAHVFTNGETLETAGSQTLTATDTQSSGITGTSNADNVSPAAATHFIVTAPSSTTAGTPGSVSVEALDQFGNVATGYVGTVHFTSTDGQAVLPIDYTFVAGDNGVHTFTDGETLKTAGSQTIGVTDTVTSSITGTSNPDNVSPAAATQFVVTVPKSTTAGTPGSVTVEALDQFGNVATGYVGTVHFTSTDGQAGLPSDYTFVAGDSGVHTFMDQETLKTAGSQTITAADTQSSSITGTSNPDLVSPAAATQFMVTVPASTTAGTPSNVTVEALDQFGNVATGYTGTVHFTSTDGQAVLPGDYTFVAGDNGVHTFTNGEMLKTAGSQTVTATDSLTPSITGTSSADIVSPAAATQLMVTAPKSTTAGTPDSVTVEALDQFGNIATGYTGTVHFTSTDAQAGLPSDYTFVAGDNGAHTFTDQETLKTVGPQTFTATDTLTSSITGTSNTDTVSPAAATHFVVTAPAATIAGAPGSLTVEALDQFGNVATGYVGTVHFTSTDAQAGLPANYTFVAADNGVHTFTNGETLKTAGSQTVSATDTVTSSITGTSNTDTVSPAAATHFIVTAPASSTAGTAGSVTVEALDQFGNVATGYVGTIHFTSTDGLAGLPSNYTFVAADKGIHTFANGETLETAGSQTVTATDTQTSSITGTSNADNVSPAAATHFDISLPATETAGAAATFTVTARDAFNNVATNYAGQIHFSSSDGAAILPPNSPLSNGVGTFSNTFETAGTQTLVASDTASSGIEGQGMALVAAGSGSLSGGGSGATLGSLDATSQLIERLYFSLLDRPADPAGLSYFDDIYNKKPTNRTLDTIASDMIGSAEFHTVHGQLNDRQFVEALYEGALGRQPEASALHRDVNELQHGVTRQALTVSVAESPEAIGHLAGRPV